MLQFHTITNFITLNGYKQDIELSYQLFGQPLHKAPIVLVNHALTGNSDVASEEKGWWKEIIGKNKLINTDTYTVIAFNIPGNGYDGTLITEYANFTAKDIARVFHTALNALKITKIFAAIGGSLGGGIAWEMACLYPKFADYIIPVAADWKATDWIIAHNAVQESILKNSKKPLEDARKMAMLFYRSPISFTQKFKRTKTENNTRFNVEAWLSHHGDKIKSRFQLEAYLLMNHLLTSINCIPEGKTIEAIFGKIEATVIQIGVNSDLFFITDENKKTKLLLDALHIPNAYHEINSVHGHDAFLIEHEQLTQFLTPIFNPKKEDKKIESKIYIPY